MSEDDDNVIYEEDEDNQSIEENLRSLSKNKKQVAQERYYRNAGQSPLTRSIASIQQGDRPPVHQRLGVQKLIRRTPRNFFNNGLTPNNPNRLRLRRTTNLAGVTSGMQSVRPGYRRPNSVQQRLYRIRPHQNLDSIIEGVQSKTKLFRRRRPDVLPSRPTNFTVQVENRNFRKQPGAVLAHSVHGSLDPQVQSEIQMIQSQSAFSHELIASEPILVPGHGSTGIFMHDRFCRLP